MASIMYNYVSFICHTMTHEPLNHIIHFPTITHKMAQISDPYKTGYLLVPSRFITEYCDTKTHHKTRRHQPRDQNQTSTQSRTARKFCHDCPKTVSKIQPELFENSPEIKPGLSENNPENFLKFPYSVQKFENLNLWSFTASKPIHNH